MNKSKQLDPELFVGRPRFNAHVWRIACEYRDAANTLYEDNLDAFVYPILVNYAFSCEIAAKSCYVQTQYNSKPTDNGLIPTACHIAVKEIDGTLFKATGHDLIKVFEQLPNLIKTNVAQSFRREIGLDLRAQLIEFRDYFDVRYSFENRPRSHSLSGIRTLSNGFIASAKEAASVAEATNAR